MAKLPDSMKDYENKLVEGGPLSPKERTLRAVAFVAACAVLIAFYPKLFIGVASLGVIILVHELGHFTVCKLSGIRVEKFSIGFGTPLLSFQRGDTIYQIGAIPLGGFVKPAGEFQESEERKALPAPDEFLGKPWYIRGLVLLAGPLANYLLPIAFFFLVYAIFGFPIQLAPPLVQDVGEKTAAQAAGIKAGDQVLKVDGQWVSSTEELASLIDGAARKHPGLETEITLLRHQKQLKLQALSRLDKASGTYRLGIGIVPGPAPQLRIVSGSLPGTPAERAGFKKGDEILAVGGKLINAGEDFPEMFYAAKGPKNAEGLEAVEIEVLRAGKTVVLMPQKKQPLEGLDPRKVGILGLEFEINKGFGESGKLSFQKMGVMDAARLSERIIREQAKAILGQLWGLVTLKQSLRENLSGPVGIVRMAKQRAEQGIFDLLNLMAFISLMLGIMNFLPIPLLDGGTLLLCVIEGIRRKPLPFKMQALAQNVAGILLISLMLFATYNDIVAWVRSLSNH